MTSASQARILVETCTNYNIHTVINMPNGPTVAFNAPGKYCWNEYLPETSDQPYEAPTDLPGFDDPEIPNDQMCAATMLAWPSDCDKNNAPKATPNGCTGVPDSDGYAADFTASCNRHDVCYATVGSSKSQCDDRLG
ncbi:MAG TPA: hypothetical protein VFN09_13640, partial [Rhodanobacteraceae bacterium]|nr:hypothetical protein [Rhodanobacteraceae bacterium]